MRGWKNGFEEVSKERIVAKDLRMSRTVQLSHRDEIVRRYAPCTRESLLPLLRVLSSQSIPFKLPDPDTNSSLVSSLSLTVPLTLLGLTGSAVLSTVNGIGFSFLLLTGLTPSPIPLLSSVLTVPDGELKRSGSSVVDGSRSADREPVVEDEVERFGEPLERGGKGTVPE